MRRLYSAADRLAGVLNNKKAVLAGDLAKDWIHVGRLAERVDRKHRFEILVQAVDISFMVRGSHSYRVRSPRRLSGRELPPATCTGSMLPVNGSTSTKIGTARSLRAQFADATNEKGVVRTRSPCFDPGAQSRPSGGLPCHWTPRRRVAHRYKTGSRPSNWSIRGPMLEMRCREHLADGRRFAERQVG